MDIDIPEGSYINVIQVIAKQKQKPQQKQKPH